MKIDASKSCFREMDRKVVSAGKGRDNDYEDKETYRKTIGNVKVKSQTG